MMTKSTEVVRALTDTELVGTYRVLAALYGTPGDATDLKDAAFTAASPLVVEMVRRGLGDAENNARTLRFTRHAEVAGV